MLVRHVLWFNRLCCGVVLITLGEFASKYFFVCKLSELKILRCAYYRLFWYGFVCYLLCVAFYFDDWHFEKNPTTIFMYIIISSVALHLVFLSLSFPQNWTGKPTDADDVGPNVLRCRADKNAYPANGPFSFVMALSLHCHFFVSCPFRSQHPTLGSFPSHCWHLTSSPSE